MRAFFVSDIIGCCALRTASRLRRMRFLQPLLGTRWVQEFLKRRIGKSVRGPGDERREKREREREDRVLELDHLQRDGDQLYAATPSGMMHSGDHGRSWKLVSPPQHVERVAAAGKLLVAATPDGLLVSTDGGAKCSVSAACSTQHNVAVNA